MSYNIFKATLGLILTPLWLPLIILSVVTLPKVQDSYIWFILIGFTFKIGLFLTGIVTIKEACILVRSSSLCNSTKSVWNKDE